MIENTYLQDLFAKLDLYLPWLLPTLETIEQTIPSTARIAVCAALLVWFAVLKHRDLASSGSGHLHSVAL